ncbi:helix-turn-helix domain-containing protein [Paenarthrobacter sp. NPDC090520]|uniref:helix-turn-helix domain-containing protein n=1 Tax=Paenarthrobacter sp. NPDC090520 TaxID=3364382 RepID=UPI0037F370F6
MHYVEDGAEALARAIGIRVRQERNGLGWTLDRLAAAAGVSRRMLVNVEQGGVNPSIGTLLRLSDALGVGLPALVEPPAPRAPKITRAGEGAVLWTGPSGGRGVLVAGTESPDVVELWDWTLAPGERHESEAHAAGTRELLQVQMGSLTVAVGTESHELKAGDAFTFRSDVAHSYANPTGEPTRFSLAVYEPGVGAGHRTEAPHA